MNELNFSSSKETIMKKILLALVCMLSIVTIYMACSKKDKTSFSNPPPVQMDNAPSLRIFVDSISVTSYGFLKFLSADNLGDFMDYLTSNDHRTVKAYLTNMGFTSIGHSLYGTSYDELTITEEQSYNYLYNTDYVFQIEDVILKPINPTSCENIKFEFILAITEENLDSTSYNSLSTGTYDPSTMNKFATGLSSNIDLLDYMSENPAGFEDEDPYSCPSTTDVEEA